MGLTAKREILLVAALFCVALFLQPTASPKARRSGTTFTSPRHSSPFCFYEAFDHFKHVVHMFIAKSVMTAEEHAVFEYVVGVRQIAVHLEANVLVCGVACNVTGKERAGLHPLPLQKAHQIDAFEGGV